MIEPRESKSQENSNWLSGVRESALKHLAAATDGRPVALLDVPTHMNVGDSLIWQGELDYLRQLPSPILYTSDIGRFRPERIRELPPETILLMQGGGNFGDLWPRFQQFREYVIDRFPKHKIVQLPQSIFYTDPKNAARTQRVLAKHNDYTLMLREWDSITRANEYFPDVNIKFVEDMALGVVLPNHFLQRAAHAKKSVLVLDRKDREKTFNLTEHLPDGVWVDIEDWGHQGLGRIAWQVRKVPGAVHKRLPYKTASRFDRLVEWQYTTLRASNLVSATRLFKHRPAVVTDRLHAHILAGLMGIPCVAVDNNYGKLGAVFDAYSHQFRDAQFTRQVSDVRQLVESLLRR